MTKSVFVISGYNDLGFESAGFTVNKDFAVASDFLYTSSESIEIFERLRAYGLQHDVQLPNYDLCDKSKSIVKFSNAGFSTLDTVLVTSRADLENFNHASVILKPAITCAIYSEGHLLDDVMYSVHDKTTLLEHLDTSNIFSNINSHAPFVVQQVADGQGIYYPALILTGAVNGQGDFWHCDPYTLETRFLNKRRGAKSVWSIENNTEETKHLQSCVERMLNAENTKNCFYQMQFLRCGDAWVPHDFQFRFAYYMQYYLGSSEYAAYKTAFIQYAFDVSLNKPVLPKTFALRVTPLGQKNTSPNKKFIAVDSKAEALSFLESPECAWLG